MRQKFSIPKPLLAVLAAVLRFDRRPRFCRGDPAGAKAPDRYVGEEGRHALGHRGQVPQGSVALADIWRMNRKEIKNPHWIYPGDVVVFLPARPTASRRSRRARARARDGPRVAQSGRRPGRRRHPSIPPGDIEPYLTRPLVTGPDGLRTPPNRSGPRRNA